MPRGQLQGMYLAFDLKIRTRSLLQTSIKLGMMGDYKFVYHNHFCVKNWHGKRVNLWSCSYQRIRSTWFIVTKMSSIRTVIAQFISVFSLRGEIWIVTEWFYQSGMCVSTVWYVSLWNSCTDIMACVTVECTYRQYDMFHCGVRV